MKYPIYCPDRTGDRVKFLNGSTTPFRMRILKLNDPVLKLVRDFIRTAMGGATYIVQSCDSFILIAYKPLPDCFACNLTFPGNPGYREFLSHFYHFKSTVLHINTVLDSLPRRAW